MIHAGRDRDDLSRISTRRPENRLPTSLASPWIFVVRIVVAYPLLRKRSAAARQDSSLLPTTKLCTRSNSLEFALGVSSILPSIPSSSVFRTLAGTAPTRLYFARTASA